MAKSYKTLVFRLRALTHMHAGAGDSFYGAVDKQVQRDPASNLPTVFSHSLKGALREYLEEEKNLDPAIVNRIFGSPVSEKNPEKTHPGAYRFFSADLIAIPSPDTNEQSAQSFFWVKSSNVLSQCLDKLKMMDKGIDINTLKTGLEKDLAVFQDNVAQFKNAAEELPVVARNCLDNGKSTNLWYEEFIPRESVFLFAVQAENGNEAAEADLKAFTDALNNQTVQIGANASVGYGYCQLSLLNAA